MAVVHLKRTFPSDSFTLAESGGRDEKSRIRRYLTWSHPSPVVFIRYGDMTVNLLLDKIRYK